MSRYYYAEVRGDAGYATPTDMLVLTCPFDCEIEILHAYAGGRATAAQIVSYEYLVRSAANVGGVKSSVPIQRYRTSAKPSQASVDLYSAAPSQLGAVRRSLALITQGLNALTTSPAVTQLTTATGAQAGLANRELLQFPVLEPGESLAINFGGAALPAGYLGLMGVMWREVT